MAENKNAYQIRLELLQEARQLLMDSFFPKQERALELFRRHIQNGDEPRASKVEFPTPPTLDEVMATAVSLRSFVDEKTN